MTKQEQHTPEPWVAATASPSFDAILGPNEEPIFSYAVDDDGLHFNPADARRIVACVNACVGIPNESLEAFNDWSKAGVASCATYRAQRDELLATLVAANKLIYATGAPLGSDKYFELRELLSNAIAKVEQSK